MSIPNPLSYDFEYLTNRAMTFCVEFLSGIFYPNAKKIKRNEWDEESACDLSKPYVFNSNTPVMQDNKPCNILQDIVVIKEQAPYDIENNMKEVTQITQIIQTMTKDPEPQFIRKWPLNFIPPRHLRIPTYIYQGICETKDTTCKSNV